MQPKAWIVYGAQLGLFAVVAGAFGAHALKEKIDPDQLAIFETAVRYQMYHALALVLVGALALAYPSRWFQVAGTAFLLGVLAFSGSLFAVVLTQGREQFKFLHLVVPAGGALFIVGWFALAVAAGRIKPTASP